MISNYCTALIASSIAITIGVPLVARSQDVSELRQGRKFEFETIGEVEAIKDAEFRIGGTDRIFLIEDDWELNRCSELLPKLPKIDTTNESLLVVMSWESAPRAVVSVQPDNDTLVIKLDEGKPEPAESRAYDPPKFLVFKLPVWKGPVRIEINNKPAFTILRGAELIERSNEIWEEILRIHSGGRPTMPQMIRKMKRTWHDASDDEIKLHIMENKERYLRIEPAPYYDLLFRDLVDIRAKPAIPRIFALIESMGKHDKASIPASRALVGIGGTEVVEQCHVAMKSWNPRARATAMGLLAAFATQEMRGMARERIAELDKSVAVNSLEILRRIGMTKDDVPYLVHALEKVAKYYAKELEDPPKLEYYDGEMGQRLICELGELGPDASEAIPILERFTTDPRLPVQAFQKNAQDALDKIKQQDPNKPP